MMNQFVSRRFFALFAIAAAACFACFAIPARAQTVSYDLDVSENLQVLNNQGNMAISMHAAWTTPASLAMARNMPYIKLTNTSTVANGGTGFADLTSFTMTIGDGTQNFDWVKLVPQFTSAGITTTVVTPDGINGGVHSDQIVLNFTGFSPGKQVEFRVDIDPDNPKANQFTDYREVFFTINGGDNTAGNSETFATFLDTQTDQEITTDPSPFLNPVDDKPTNMGLQFHAAYMGDHVRWFQTGDSQSVVPEPATIVLGALGAVGVSIAAFRRRRM